MQASSDHETDKITRQITILFLINVAFIAVAIISGNSRNSIIRIIQLSAMYLHTPIGIWIGILITKSYQTRWLVIAYWLSVSVPVVFYIAPYVFSPLLMFFPFGIAPAGVFIQWAIITGILSKRFTKGRWPLPIALLFTVASVIFILINMSFRTTEFGPLGMLFVNMFATPVLIIVPALLRIPASSDAKKYLRQSQYATYGCIVIFWIIFAARSFAP